MASRIQYLEQVAAYVSNNQDMIFTLKCAGKQAAWAASGAATGGLLVGPAGALIGGMVGSVIGYAKSENYQNVWQLVMAMSDDQKRNLAQTIMGVVGGASIEAFYSWFTASSQNPAVLMNLCMAAIAMAQSPR